MTERFRAVVAVHLLLVADGTVLLLRRANTGYEDGNYSVPAGHLDGGETVTSAAIREAREETGMDLRPANLEHGLVMHRKAGDQERIDFFLRVSGWTDEPKNCEPDKCDELSWHRLDSLPENTVPYVRAGIDAWRQGKRYLEHGWD
jgi:8-oxo-dGTP pyrophosphatase MutT (NUDIX family)